MYSINKVYSAQGCKSTVRGMYKTILHTLLIRQRLNNYRVIIKELYSNQILEMARIKTSAFFSDIAGSIGGTTFQGNQAGLIMKSKQIRPHKASISQNSVNNNMYRCQYEWQQLTTCQRQTWNSFANFIKKNQKHSNDRNLNGHQLFIQCNFYRLQYGHTILTSPQFVRNILNSFEGFLQKVGTDLKFTTDRILNATNEFIILQTTSKISNSLNNPGSRYRNIIFAVSDTDNWIINTEFENVFGFIPTSANRLFYRYTVADLRTGIIQQFQTKSVTF